MDSNYRRCTVCGKTDTEIACDTCIIKYGGRYDLSSPDGRFQARQEEQGSPLERQRLQSEAEHKKLEDKRQMLREKREPLFNKMNDKLNAAQTALFNSSFKDMAEALKGIERLAKKLLETENIPGGGAV
jgi:hypothetical protein